MFVYIQMYSFSCFLTLVDVKMDYPYLCCPLGISPELSDASGRNLFLTDFIPFPGKQDVIHLNAYTPLAKVHGTFQHIVSFL